MFFKIMIFITTSYSIMFVFLLKSLFGIIKTIKKFRKDTYRTNTRKKWRSVLLDLLIFLIVRSLIADVHEQ